MKWLKELLYGKVRAANMVFYGPIAPNPRKGWLKKLDLTKGDLWFDIRNQNTPHTWTGTEWRTFIGE